MGSYSFQNDMLFSKRRGVQSLTYSSESYYIINNHIVSFGACTFKTAPYYNLLIPYHIQRIRESIINFLFLVVFECSIVLILIVY